MILKENDFFTLFSGEAVKSIDFINALLNADLYQM